MATAAMYRASRRLATTYREVLAMVSIPQSKTCLRCGKTKAIDEFWKDKPRKDGRSPYCKVCGRALNNARYPDERDTRIEYSRQRWQHDKNDPSYRQAANKRTSEWAKRNPSKRSAIMEAWRVANQDHVRQYGREYKQRNKERVQESARRRVAAKKAASIVPFTIDQLTAKCAYWGNCCWLCGGEQQAIDHVKPLAKGGPHVLANLRPICRDCNLRKSDKWPYP